jgi:protein required for attachment to host cells
MEQTCIVVANASRARFFFQQGDSGELQEGGNMVDTATRLRTAETETDRLGPTSAGKSIHNTGGAAPNKAYEPPQTPQEHETELFARSIVGHLQERLQNGEFDQLALIASPEFLGVLRGLLSPQLKNIVRWDINKDYTQLTAPQLRDRLPGNGGAKGLTED